jgi:hypothetical protein
MANPTERIKSAVRLRGRVVWPIVAMLVVVIVGWNGFTVYIQPGQWGVKQVTLGSGAGVHPETFPPAFTS